jgi:hypothetical protein
MTLLNDNSYLERDSWNELITRLCQLVETPGVSSATHLV